jgi:hypothetical protein
MNQSNGVAKDYKSALEEILVNEKVSWLDEAATVTSGSRRRDYGRPLPNFLRICLRDNIQDAGRRLPFDYISPVDVALRNIEQKLAREQNTHKGDNYVDTMGYANCVWDMHQQMIELGFSDGVAAFKRMNMQDMFALLLLTGDTAAFYRPHFDLSHRMLSIMAL